MRAAVFIGPSLPAGAAWPEGVERLPPAGLGDLYRLAARAEPPAVIGLVDGYFERRPPVRHKEILWALGRGIRVLGAASIGALRAAELADLGMEGLGAIFAGYRDGELFGEPLEADDEVAVLHGPAELGYPAVTLALVDLRATAAAAREAGRLSSGQARDLVAAARRLHFKERSRERLLEAATVAPDAAAWLAERLQARQETLKQADARLLLTRVAALAQEAGSPVARRPAFRVDDAWLDFVEWAAPAETATAASGGELQVALALDPALRRRAERQGQLRILARRDALRRGRDETGALEALLDLYAPAIAGQLRAALADLGALAEVEAGIRRRRRARQALDSGEAEPRLPLDRILAWHFARSGEPPPADLDGYVHALGLARRQQFLRAVIEDYVASGSA